MCSKVEQELHQLIVALCEAGARWPETFTATQECINTIRRVHQAVVHTRPVETDVAVVAETDVTDGPHFSRPVRHLSKKRD